MRIFRALRRYILAKGFVVCVKCGSDVYFKRGVWQEKTCDSDYVNWYGIADWFEKWYWNYLRREVPQ